MSGRYIRLLTLLIFSPCLAFGDAPIAHPFVAPIFTDHMVLQRDQPDPIWGWAKPGETITVSINDSTASATADTDGKWVTQITPPPAGGPYELTVTGSQSITFSDVLVGDVWVCAGQSNMEFGLLPHISQIVIDVENEIYILENVILRGEYSK